MCNDFLDEVIAEAGCGTGNEENFSGMMDGIVKGRFRLNFDRGSREDEAVYIYCSQALTPEGCSHNVTPRAHPTMEAIVAGFKLAFRILGVLAEARSL